MSLAAYPVMMEGRGERCAASCQGRREGSKGDGGQGGDGGEGGREERGVGNEGREGFRG
jgi:hypothetical protein